MQSRSHFAAEAHITPYYDLFFFSLSVYILSFYFHVIFSLYVLVENMCIWIDKHELLFAGPGAVSAAIQSVCSVGVVFASAMARS